MACKDREESFTGVCHAALCLMQIRGVTLLMTQFAESDNALSPVFVPFFKNSYLQVKVNFSKTLVRCRDARPGMEPYSILTSKSVDLHISKH